MTQEIRVSIVNPVVSEDELRLILSEIERIAYEIAQEGDSDGICEVDAG